MTFDDITNNGELWAVRYDREEDNELRRLFNLWSDIEWLDSFFTEHFNDLAYFKVMNVEQAIYDTIEDNERLESVFLECKCGADLEGKFRPLDNNVTVPKEKEKMKTRGDRANHHDSWLRIYAIRLCDGKYIVTGGAIKLTEKMEEREHTQNELDKLERVKRFLTNEGIVDDDGFIDYLALQ